MRRSRNQIVMVLEFSTRPAARAAAFVPRTRKYGTLLLLLGRRSKGGAGAESGALPSAPYQPIASSSNL